MAKVCFSRREFPFQPKDKEPRKEFIEQIEARIWGLGGTPSQSFNIGSGANFGAHANIWLEIIYSVNGAQIFYTRTFLHASYEITAEGLKSGLEDFRKGKRDSIGFGDMLPETHIVLSRESYEDQFSRGKKRMRTYYDLVISADVGAVMSAESPGSRTVDIKINYIPYKEGIKFIRDLSNEILRAKKDIHPDPAKLPAGSSNWPFVRALNQQAYDRISEYYQENYFNNPALTAVFDEWLTRLPPGGHIMDAGCGHGTPVIPRLLEHGFRVTGSDLSPEMIRLARKNFPELNFIHRETTEVDEEDVYDGICSLNSMLYLDPIDLHHAIYRIFHALKPGGMLFLFAFDSHPTWRGEPLDHIIDQWMWAWTYSLAEAQRALTEHGYFKVLKSAEVTTEAEKKRLHEQWLKYNTTVPDIPGMKIEDERLKALLAELPEMIANSNPQLPYCYAIIAKKRQKKSA